MTSPAAARWLRAFRGLAIDLAKIVWKPVRFVIVLAAFVCAGVALLVLIGQGGAMSGHQILVTLAVLVPSLVIVGSVIVPRLRGGFSALRRFSPREAAKDVGAAVVEGSRSLLALIVAYVVGLGIPIALGAGIWWAIAQYRTGDGLLSTPLGPSICVGRLQDTLTRLAPERDPQVEKCTRQETEGSAPLFMCFARMLDRGGIYRVAPCSVTCETSGEQAAKSYQRYGLGPDDVCSRSP